ncbi:MAG: acetate uptake transporter [Vallitaleaceae bacterium]|nr:acetate uptake transporter [Vallitaleaceae bacterium]
MEERKIVVADPTAIGLFGLAIVTLVASSQKLGITSGTSLIIPWAIFLGAAAQLYACIQDAKKNNVFGATAFGAFAFFWFGVAMTWMIQNGAFGAKMAENADVEQLGFAFVGYLIFCLYMTVASMTTNKMLFIIFIFIDLLFLGLSLNALGISESIGHPLAAWSELIISLIGFYGSAANIINYQFGKIVLPLGKPLYIKK